MKSQTINKLIFVLLFFLGALFLSSLFFHSKASVSPIGIAHAATDLHDDLTVAGSATSNTKWIFDVWKISLGIVDVFIVFVLLFLAIVNILHIQYDTYQIKKSLPLLIGGAIAANFSLLICRMIVDVAQVLVLTFVPQSNTELAHGYLCSVAISSQANPFATILTALPSIILVIIAGIVILIAVIVLAFLLWIRKFVIYLLVAVAPLAMILYAFPPTQSLFKQWWNQFLRWVFMGPIVMAMIYVASIIGANNCKDFSLSALLAVVGVTILAFIVPFRLGGAIMGRWAGAGKKAGLGGGKYIAKKADYGMQRYGGKYAKYAPTAQWDKYKLNKARKEEEVRGGALASARGERYRTAFQAGLSDKRFKEDFLDTYGGMSKDVAQKSFAEGIEKGDMTAIQGAVAAAANEGFIGDQMEAISNDDERGKKLKSIISQKYKAATGLELTADDLSEETLKTHAGKDKIYQALFLKNADDQEGLAKITRIQDGATKDGDWAAMSVFEEDGKYKMLDRSVRKSGPGGTETAEDKIHNDKNIRKMQTVWRARLNSGNARQNVGKTRKDTFATEEERKFFIDSMSPEMVNAMSNMRSGAGAALREGSGEVKKAGTGMQLLRSTPQGRQYLEMMAKRGLISKDQVDPPTTLKVTTADTQGRPQETIANVGDIDLNATGVTPETRVRVEADIISKANHLTGDELDQFADSVVGNASVSEPVRAKITVHKSWEAKVKTAAAISQTDSRLAEQQTNELMDGIHNDIAEAAQSSVDVPIKIKKIIDAIPPRERLGFQKRLEGELTESSVPAMTVQGQPISFRQVILIRNKARSIASANGKFDKMKYDLELSTLLDKMSPSGRVDSESYEQFQKITDTISGGKDAKAPRPTKAPRRVGNSETPQEAADREDEETEELR